MNIPLRAFVWLLFLPALTWAETAPALSLTDEIGGKKIPAFKSSNFVFSLLPKAFQKKPLLDFNVMTEMTPAGRKLTPPTPDHPVYYVQQAGKYIQTGSAPAGNEHAPPLADLEQAMKRSLATGGYLLGEPPAQQPALLIIFNYGSHNIDPPVPPEPTDPDAPPPQAPVTAEEMLPFIAQDIRLQRDLFERAALIGGGAFAIALRNALADEVENMNTNYSMQQDVTPVSPNRASPFQRFLSGKNSDLISHLVEDAFHSCYFVVATAYDYAAVARGEKRLLWRTKMTVDAQGVNMKESLGPLIASAGPLFGREMTEATVVSRKISREGTVTIGTAVEVPDPPAPSPPK